MNRSIKSLMLLAVLSVGSNSFCAQENVEQANWPKIAGQVALGSLCIAAAAYGAMNAEGVSYVAQLCPEDAKKEMMRYACRGTAASLLSSLSFYLIFNVEDDCDDNCFDKAAVVVTCPLLATVAAINIASAYQIFNQAH